MATELLLSYAEALDRIHAHVPSHLPLTEESALHEAGGRILASDLHALLPHPPFTNSMMDGFAIASCRTVNATADHPLILPVTGVAHAGRAPVIRSTDGAIEITTGAPLPAGPWDAVIKIEDVEVLPDQHIRIRHPVQAAGNIRFLGSDFSAGELALTRGTQLSPEHLMLLAAVGAEMIPVLRKPKAICLSTGDEVSSGLIPNSTRPLLMELLKLNHVAPTFLGAVPDDPKLLRNALSQALDQNPDLLLTTGAVSMGNTDYIPGILGDLGFEVIFHRLAIRPGKPVLFAKKGKTTFFGIPGNPVSSLVVFHALILPWIHRSLRIPKKQIQRASLTGPISKPGAMTCFYKARLFQDEKAVIRVDLLAGQESFRLKPLLNTNVLALLPAGREYFNEHDLVEVFPLRHEVL